MDLTSGVQARAQAASRDVGNAAEPTATGCFVGMMRTARRRRSSRRRAAIAPGNNGTTLWLLLLSFLFSHQSLFAADPDPVEEVLATRPTADPQAIEHVEELIKTHATHPKILELRYYRTGQLMGSSQDPAHFRRVIEDLRQLAKDAGAGSVLAFRCGSRIGEICFHCLRDKQAAYAEYSALEQHPSLAGHTLDEDFRRTELYVHIAQSAFAIRDWTAVEVYARLAMAYPYLGMEDRAMYQRFYDLHEEAGRLFVVAFSDNPAKLLSVEIYPSHPELYRRRAQLIAEAVGATQGMDQMFSPEEVKRSLEAAQADSDNMSADVAGLRPTHPASHTAPSQGHADGASTTNDEGGAGDTGACGSSTPGGRTLPIVIASGMAGVVAVGVAAYLVKRRKAA